MNLEISGGLVITHVAEGSPAANAGLREGMIVVAVGSRQVVNEKDLPRELLKLQAGGRVRLQIIFVQSLGLINIQRGQAVVLIAR
jgi:S1-C subfamily serine protease